MIVQVNGYTVYMVSLCQPWRYPPKLPVSLGKNTYTYTVHPSVGSHLIWYLILFSGREEFCWMNGLNKKNTKSPWRFVRFGWWERVTFRPIPKLAKFPLLIILTATAEICWNETICSRLWRYPCLGSQFWCNILSYTIHEPITIILWATHLCTLQGKHPNFGGHSGALGARDLPPVAVSQRGWCGGGFLWQYREKYILYTII